MFFAFVRETTEFKETHRKQFKQSNPFLQHTMEKKIAEQEHTYLGYGAAGLVFQATYNNKQVAAKQVQHWKTRGSYCINMEKTILSEIKIMQQLHHPNLVGFIDAFPFGDNHIIITELCSGGELFDAILNKDELMLPEIRRVARDMLRAIRYMHQMNIVHRDLKPENVMLVSKWEDGKHIPHVKIIDFGHAVKCTLTGLSTPAGTYGYMAPEVEGYMAPAAANLKPYGKECDLWSMGVVMYVMTTGVHLLLEGENATTLDLSLTSAKWESFPNGTDADAIKNFVQKFLTIDSQLRITADQALRDPFIENLTTDEDNTPIADNILSHNFGQFVAMGKLKRLIRYKIVEKLTTGDKLRYVKAFETHTREQLMHVLTPGIKDCCNALNITKAPEWDVLEFIAGVMNQDLYNTYEAVNMAFKSLDLDENGQISERELAIVVGERNASDIMSDPELNHSGEDFFNLEEFNLYFENASKPTETKKRLGAATAGSRRLKRSRSERSRSERSRSLFSLGPCGLGALG